MEIVIARVRLLEILVESPPRVNAAWLVRVRAATPFFCPYRWTTAITAQWKMIFKLKS